MNKTPLLFVALALAIPAFAEYANSDAACRDGDLLTTARRFDQAIAAYEEGMALATSEPRRIGIACQKANAQVKAGRNAAAVKLAPFIVDRLAALKVE